MGATRCTILPVTDASVIACMGACCRYDSLDRDNQGLRKKVAELIKLGEKRSKAGALRSMGLGVL